MLVDVIKDAADDLQLVARRRGAMAEVVARIEAQVGNVELRSLKDMAVAIDRASWEFDKGAFTGILVAVMLGLEAGARIAQATTAVVESNDHA